MHTLTARDGTAARFAIGVLAAALTVALGVVGLHGAGAAVSVDTPGARSVAGAVEPDLAMQALPSGGAEAVAGEPTAPSSPPPTHHVQPGETVSQIADHHGVALGSLVHANALERPDRLRPGQRLVLPDPTAERPLTPQEAMAAELEVEAILEQAAERFGWSPATVKAVAWVESRWNQRLVSNRGAIGVMQVQPATGQLVESHVGRPLDLHDMEDNALAGVAYLDLLYQRHRGDVRAVLAAYHQGPAALRDHGPYPLSVWYADEVLRLREVFRAG